MKALQVILIAFTALAGCNKSSDVAANELNNGGSADTVRTVTKGPFTYLALGDSYTIGQSVPASDSYPVQLAAQLNAGPYIVKTPKIIATTGWTTQNLMDAIAADQISQYGTTYSFVTLLIGVNDQFQGMDTSEYHKNFITLVHTAIKFAGGDNTRVFVLSIPDYGVTPFGKNQQATISPQIDLFNSINKAESAAAGVNYLDITGISREAATNPALIASDGLHPSGAMYTLWIQQLEPMVAKRLNKM